MALGFPGNDHLLLRDEPGYRGGAPTEEAADDRCPVCGSPPLPTDVCLTCAPACSLDYTPVLWSFAIDGATGAVTSAGWCTEEIGLFLEEHTP